MNSIRSIATERRGRPGTSRRGGKRNSTRRDRLADVQLELVLGAGHAIAFERFDLSAVGVYLYSDLLLSEGEDVSLNLKLPFSQHLVTISGRVVRAQVGDQQQPAGMGVAFCDLDAGVRQDLRDFVAQRFFRRAT